MTAAASDDAGGPGSDTANGLESATGPELRRLLAEERAAQDASAAREAALADILALINASAGDPQPVFEAILEKAHNLCDATLGSLQIIDGELFRAVATRGMDDEFADFLRRGYTSSGPFLSREKTVQIPDMAELARETPDNPVFRAAAGRTRTLLCLPLIKDGKFLGRLFAGRHDVRPFTDKQIALLESFAAQAAMAMENARLLGEQREALERQTAAAEVLATINANPGALQPVFDIIVEKSVQLIGCDFGVLNTFDGTDFHSKAHFNAQKLWDGFLSEPLHPAPGTAFAQLVQGEDVVHVHDVREGDLYATSELRRKFADLTGARTAIWVALRQNRELFGALLFYRTSVNPFSDQQVELLKNFAAQAVMAMENARLIIGQREALERQTATAEVLATINASPGAPQPVFDVILDKAHEICSANMGALTAFDGERFRVMALHGFPEDYWDIVSGGIPAEDVSTLQVLVAGERCTRHPDLKASDIEGTTDYGRKVIRYLKDRTNIRSTLMVPMRKDGELLGYITAYRTEIRPFSDRDLELLENFAAQAVIAIENARLLSELRQRTEEVAELNRGLEARVAAQVEELSRVGRLKRFLAPQLAELIVSQGHEKILESHRREIVVVFCDLRGYTAFTETAEPEEVLDFLRAYHGALGPLVAEYEGTLDQFSGDGIMVFFNDPVPIPDPAERAVKMAMAMRAAAGKLIAEWRERGRELGFGTGIAQGYATLGQIGFSERAGYTAIGTVCNVAARLCAEAADGQILLSQRVNAALKGSIATEQIGALDLKGLTQPVMAYNVPAAPTRPTLRMIEGGDPQSV